MPKGKGTYGNKVGRPKKDEQKEKVKKYHALKGASKWRYDMTGGRMT